MALAAASKFNTERDIPAAAFHIHSAAATGHVVRQVSRLAEAAAVRSWSFHTKELAAPGTDWKNFDELVAAELKADETVPSANSLKDPDHVELPPQAAQRPRGSVCGIAGTTAYSAKLLALLPGATPLRQDSCRPDLMAVGGLSVV